MGLFDKSQDQIWNMIPEKHKSIAAIIIIILFISHIHLNNSRQNIPSKISNDTYNQNMNYSPNGVQIMGNGNTIIVGPKPELSTTSVSYFNKPTTDSKFESKINFTFKSSSSFTKQNIIHSPTSCSLTTNPSGPVIQTDGTWFLLRIEALCVYPNKIPDNQKESFIKSFHY